MTRSLKQELRERIRSSGPLPFSEFMQAALYHPTDGYYATRVPGHGSHYRTSPSLTPWFGRLVAREFRRMWHALGGPDPFWVVEVGGGQGDLAADAMAEAHSMSVPVRWRFIEHFDRIRDRQRRRLGPATGSAEWSTGLSGQPVIGCVLANEVLDNFPVHVLEVTETGTVHEVYVDVDDDGFVERLGRLSDVTLGEPARNTAAHLAPGARFEISSGVATWCRDASRALTRGYLLLIDYGSLEPDVWLAHPEGTVTTYGREEATPSPLDEPGSKDITADVNFSAVARAAHSAGFHPEPVITQANWLLTLGIAQVAEQLETAGFMAALDGLVEEATLLQGELGRLMELGDAEGLGSLLVLRAAKDAPVAHPSRASCSGPDSSASRTPPTIRCSALRAIRNPRPTQPAAAPRRTLVTVTPAQLRERLSMAPAAGALRLAVLHGSRARADATKGSDWDIGVLADEPPDLPALSATLADILGTDDVDVVDLRRASALLRYRTARDGIPLLERPAHEFLRFQLEAVQFWCDAETVIRSAHDDVLAALG